MKGPGLRIDCDVRRVWRCASCNTERHTPGRATLVHCHFCQDHPLMSLVEPQRAYRGPVEPPDLVINLHPDDVDAPAFVPAHLREPDETEEQPTDVEEASAAQAPLESAAASDTAEAGEAPTSEECLTEDTPQEQTKSRRKKNRRNKRRSRKNDPPTQAASDGPQKKAPSSPTADEDSFGAGLDTT